MFWDMSLTLPLIYLTLTLLRGILIAAFTPLIRRLSGSDIDLSWQVRSEGAHYDDDDDDDVQVRFVAGRV